MSQPALYETWSTSFRPDIAAGRRFEVHVNKDRDLVTEARQPKVLDTQCVASACSGLHDRQAPRGIYVQAEPQRRWPARWRPGAGPLRLSEDVIAILTVKQGRPLPAPTRCRRRSGQRLKPELATHLHHFCPKSQAFPQLDCLALFEMVRLIRRFLKMKLFLASVTPPDWP